LANRQTLPQAITPIAGDVASAVGSPTVTVTGIQQTPVLNQQPQPGQILIFDGPTGFYIPGDPIVSGPDAVGNSPSRPPVQVAGIDDSNFVREVRTDTYGGLQLSIELRETLRQILNQLKALTRAVVNLDNTNQDSDYVSDKFDNVDPMQ
jgi:hypothetical protein